MIILVSYYIPFNTVFSRKLAIINWNMLVKGQNYGPPTQYMFLDEKRRMGLVKRLQKQITKFDIQPEQLGFTNA